MWNFSTASSDGKHSNHSALGTKWSPRQYQHWRVKCPRIFVTYSNTAAPRTCIFIPYPIQTFLKLLHIIMVQNGKYYNTQTNPSTACYKFLASFPTHSQHWTYSCWMIYAERRDPWITSVSLHKSMTDSTSASLLIRYYDANYSSLTHRFTSDQRQLKQWVPSKQSRAILLSFPSQCVSTVHQRCLTPLLY